MDADLVRGGLIAAKIRIQLIAAGLLLPAIPRKGDRCFIHREVIRGIGEL